LPLNHMTGIRHIFLTHSAGRQHVRCA
jgi:hypothetical protein